MAFAVTFILGVLAGPVLGGGATPSPFADSDRLTSYFSAHRAITAGSAWLLLLSAVPLLLFSAVAYSRLTFLAPNAPGPVIAGIGGVAAATLLAAGAVVTWVLSRPEITGQPEVVRALHYLDFMLGGPAHTAALGVMLLGLAVTAIFINRTPRVLSVIGISVAVVDLLSTISLLAEPLAVLVPVGRFLSIAWLVVLSLLVPRERGPRRPASE